MLEFIWWHKNILTDTASAQIVLRFITDLVAIGLLVSIYLGQKKDKRYGFTFLLFNILIFFICYLMLRVEISMGFAFGLFAMFGILRYRTNSIPIKDMTYLFTAITLALINAISPIDWTMAFMNICILIFVFAMEKLWFADKEQFKNINYEKIDLIEQQETEKIIEDLRRRTRLDVTRFEIRTMNLVNDTASLKVYYKP